MKPKCLKELLLSEIKSVTERFNEFCVESGKHFTRKRKLPFETVIKTVIGMESKSLANELINAFDAEPTLPSEKEIAYKMKLDAMKCQAGIRRASGRKSKSNPVIYPFNKLGFERIKSNEMLKIENKYMIWRENL